jgi:hypothetical protein
MSAKIAECLYYRTWTSFLRRSKEFQTDYKFLLEHKNEFPTSFDIFTQNDLNRISLMDHFFKTGQFLCFKISDPVFSDTVPQMEDTKESHRNIIRKLYDDREKSICPYTDGIDFICPEFPVESGNIDLVVYSKNIAYAIELKTTSADHSIIGQVLKYYIGLSLNLCHKFYNDVKLITICPGYDKTAFWGLKQMGVRTLLLDPYNLKVSDFF